MPDIIKYVEIVPPKQAGGVVKDVYQQARREIGRLPEAVTMFSPVPTLLAAAWAAFREPLLVTGQVPRPVKEAVAATVSQLNECTYCVDAHSIMLYGSGGGNFANALLSGAPGQAQDPAYREVAGWARACSTRESAPAQPPVPASQVPELVGTLVQFHFLNRAINVLLRGTFLPGSARAHGVARKIAGRVMSKYLQQPRQPGKSAGLTSGRPLPADLHWAAPQPHIAAAMSALSEAAADGARRSLSPDVVRVVTDAVRDWNGEPVGISASWVDQPLSRLAPADRPAARVALLTALAPVQLTDTDVAAFRASSPGDQQLLDVLGWASFLAARRIGSWTAPAKDVPAGPVRRG